LECEFAHHVGPTRDEFRTDRSLDQREHLLFVRRVDGDRDAFDDEEGFFERTLERRDDDDRVNVALEVRECLGEDFSSYSHEKPREI
jgi:hypothetical protein